jgi:Flp pilus assembly pilin Flp
MRYKTSSRFFSVLRRDSRGATLAEYAILLMVLIMACLFAVQKLGIRTHDIYCYAASAIAFEDLCDDDHVPPPPPPPQIPAAVVTGATGPACKEYWPGDEMIFTVTYNKIVTSDDAYIDIDVGGVIKQAALKSGSGTETLTFSYIVVDGDDDAGGVSFADRIVYGEVTDADNLAAVGEFSELIGEQTCAAAIKPDTCTENCMFVGMTNGFLMKLGDTGKPAWKKNEDGTSVTAVAVAPDGSILSGTTGKKLRKHSADGNLLWSRSIAGKVNKIAVTKDGDVIVAHSGGGIVKFYASGSQQYAFADNLFASYANQGNSYTSDYFSGLAVDAFGSAYATTAYGQFIKIRTSDLKVQWNYRITDTARLVGVGISENGLIWTTGWSPATYQPYPSQFADRAQAEMVHGWRDQGGATGILIERSYGIEGQPSAIIAGAENRVVVNINGRYGQVVPYMFGFQSTSASRLWEKSSISTVLDLAMDGTKGGYWLAKNANGRGSFNYYDLKTGKEDLGKLRYLDTTLGSFAVAPGVYGAGF